MAAKKNTKTSTKKCRGRGKQKTATPSSPKAADPPAHDPPAVYQAGRSQPSRSPSPPSGDDSRASRASSVDSVAASVASTSSHQPDGNTKKKRAKKSACSMSVPDEELMLDFLQDNPVLWNMKMTDYRRTDKKGKIWDDQAQRMGKTSELLKGWFKSLRDTHTRLDRKKSGDGAPELTEREEWIMAKFGFLKTVIRHRPEPCNSVKATIDAHVGDLDAAEAACAEQEVGLQEPDIIPTHPSSRRKRARDDDGALLESLQKRVQESGEILKDLSHAHQQPITERTAFATYVRDSLISMSKPKFKKTRSAINKMLSQLMEEDSDDDIPRSIEDPVMSDPRPRSSAPSSSSVSAPSEMYQPPPHMWRHKAPPASVWGSQTQEYMEQYMQQPMQYQQRPAPQMMPPPLPALNQQQQQQHTSLSVSTTLGLAAEALNQSPITFDNNISNTSNLSNISGLSGLINMSPVMDVDVDMNTPPAKKSFVNQVFHPFSAGIIAEGVFKQLLAETSNYTTDVTNKVSQRQWRLNTGLNFNIQNKVKLPEKELKMTILQAARMMEAFYPSHVISGLSISEEDYWEQKQLEFRDWTGLASQKLSQIFSKTFLVPLEKTDNHFQLTVQHVNLSKYIRLLDQSDFQDDLDLVTEVHTPTGEVTSRAPHLDSTYFNPAQKIVQTHRFRTASRRRRPWSSPLYSVEFDKLEVPLPIPHPAVTALSVYNRENEQYALNFDDLFSHTLIKAVKSYPYVNVADPTLPDTRDNNSSPDNGVEPVSIISHLAEQERSISDDNITGNISPSTGSPTWSAPSPLYETHIRTFIDDASDDEGRFNTESAIEHRDVIVNIQAESSDPVSETSV